MLNCIGPAQQPKVLTPEVTPGALLRPWLVSTLPIPASSCQVSAGQVWAAWMYRARYPEGISASANALALTVGPGGMPGAVAGPGRTILATARPTAAGLTGIEKPGEAMPPSSARTRTRTSRLETLSCWSGRTWLAPRCSRAAYQAAAASAGLDGRTGRAAGGAARSGVPGVGRVAPVSRGGCAGRAEGAAEAEGPAEAAWYAAEGAAE